MAHRKRQGLLNGAEQFNPMIDDPSSKNPMFQHAQKLNSDYSALISKADLNKGKEPKLKLRNKAQALYWYLKKLEGIIAEIRENEANAPQGGHDAHNEKMVGLLLYDDDIRRNYHKLLDYVDMYKSYQASHGDDEDPSEDWTELDDCLALDFADKRTLDQRVQACIQYLEGDQFRAAMHEDSMGERYVAAVKFLAKEVMAVKTICGRQAQPPTGPAWHWGANGEIGESLEERIMQALRPAEDLRRALNMDRMNVTTYKRRIKFPTDGDHELDLALSRKWEKALLSAIERQHTALMSDIKSGPGGGYSLKIRLNGGAWKRDAKYAPPDKWRLPKTHFGRFGCGQPGRGSATYTEMTQLTLCGLSSHPKASRYDGCRAVALETPIKYHQWNMTRVLVLSTGGGMAKTMILGAKYLRPYTPPPMVADITPSVIVDDDGDYYS